MKPRLLFTPAGPNEGFRSAGLSIYSNVDPDTLLRELFQNAVDASRPGHNIQIRMKFETVKTSDVPGIDAYRSALEQAIETQRERGALENAKNVTDAMEECSNEQEITILWVMDNGVGLSPDHMDSLLGDGQSAKQDASNSGAFGNGHITVFPASDLRFMLYGGVFEKEGKTQRIFSGHTILASRQDLNRNAAFGKDGYLVQELRANDLFDRFDFCDETTNAPMLHSRLDEIENAFGSGSCVGIVGFNHFNDVSEGGGRSNLEKTIKTIERVASVHFLPLVFENKLEVSIYQSDQRIGAVNSDCLHEVLARTKNQRRRRNRSIGPRGSHSWATLDAHEQGKRLTLSTSLGDIDTLVLKGRDSDADGTNIQLFRNGMWITNAVPRNEAHRFQSRQSFTAVLLLQPDSALRACELIRDCEGPRHIDILPARLGRNTRERKEFDKFFEEIYDQLIGIAPEKSTEEFDPGFLLVDAVGREALGKAPTGKNRVPIDENDGPIATGKRKKSGTKTQPILGRMTTPFQTKCSTVLQNGSVHIVIKPLARADRVVLRLKETDGVDATCDTPLQPTYLNFGKDLSIEGNGVKALAFEPSLTDQTKDTVATGNQITAVEFGPVQADSEVRMEIPFNGMNGTGVQPVIYRASRPRATHKKAGLDAKAESNG